MNFELNEDEEMLKAVVDRFVTDRYDVERRREFLSLPHGFSRKNWELLAELGVMAVPFAEECGGLGLDATALAVTFEALGRGIVVEPVLESAILPGLLMQTGNNTDLAEAWIPRILSGEARLGVGHPAARSANGVQARPADGGFVLDGEVPHVIAGAGAEGFVIAATLPDGTTAWLLVEAGAAGLTASSWRLADGTDTASLRLEAVQVRADARIEHDPQALDRVFALASLARCAEALGVMEKIFAETLDYLRTREQFGAPIGSFQAIQHRMATQYTALEQSRALVKLATVKDGSAEFSDHVDGARAFIAEASIALGHEMIQFHGGMGVTDELSVGQGHKRLLVLSRWPEMPMATLDRYAAAA
ncbi:acyl-CoA dehydrogenase family protein [Croceicoccus bisphenolivorans]|uniref:acyl-CoA dehydrogenase family protein n=1 Tax=Croceicoccus bisphenolivorans TaxID=1783232 RepID=UPI000835A1CE|nr:acyl-CoA dehydrogenase family protein [Croceicoccus bisphenolivorans]